MTVVEHRGQLLVIDCGVLFPDDHHPGIDLILPDFEYIKDRLDDVQAVVLTHGHEDHIGAVPYLLRLQARPPARRLDADAGARRGQAQGAPDHARTRSACARATASGSGCSTASSSPSTTPSPTPSPSPCAPRAARCCTPATSRWTSCRSTAGSPTCGPSRGWGRRASTSSSPTRPTPRCPGSRRPSATSPRPSTRCSGTRERRIIVACFSSHVHRVQQVLDAAEKAGRKVAMVGRSMVRNMGIAADLGYLHVPDGVLVDVKRLDDLRDDEVVLICTGSQGEPMAALSRMANRDHRIDVGPGDTVLLASLAHPRQRERRLPRHQRPHAPGRQRRAQGQRQGARLGPRQRRRAALLLQHRPAAQRHAGARRVAPPRGQRRARDRHRASRATGSSSSRTASSSTSSTASRASPAPCPCGYVYVDGSSVGAADETLLKDRRILRDEGFISVIVVVDSMTGKVVAGPEITARGFVEDDVVFDDVMPQLVAALDEATANGVTDSLPAAAGHPPLGRRLGRSQDPPAADDHPDGRRGLSTKSARRLRVTGESGVTLP